ncbi:MAG: CHASE3 domain-containing protein [Bacteroidia bacterium]|nr:CHASE3 domain-containing protein [Bacteroidia bacterium]
MSSKGKILFIVFILVGLLSVLFYLVQRIGVSALENNHSIERIERTLYHTNRLLIFTTDIETSGRGYILTNNKEVKKPGELAVEKIYKKLDTLHRIFANKPDQMKRLDTLEILIKEKVELGNQIFYLVDQGKGNDAKELVNTLKGHVLMEKIRKQVDLLITNQKTELENQRINRAQNEALLIRLAKVVFILIILVLISGGWALAHNFVKKEILQSRLEGIVNHIPASIFIVNNQFKVTLANQNLSNTLKRPTSLIEGKSIHELFPDIISEELEENFIKIKNGSEGMILEKEQNFDGEIRHYVTFLFKFENKTGATEEFGCLTVDVTTNKKSELERKKAVDIFKELYDKAPIGIHSINLDGQIVRSNKTGLQWLGIPDNENLNHIQFVDLLDRNSVPKFINALNQLFIKGSINNLHLDICKKDGSLLNATISGITEKNNEGNIELAHLTLIDNTRLELAFEELEKLNQELATQSSHVGNLQKELEAFFFTLSHDLRNPIRNITGYAQLLGNDLYSLDIENSNKNLKKIIEFSESIGGKLDDLLEFFRITNRKPSFQNCDLDEVVNNTLQNSLPEGILDTIKLKILPLPKIWADQEFITLMMENLVMGSIRSSSKKIFPYIEISAEENNQEVIISIKDNGSIFQQNKNDRMFGVFQNIKREDETHPINLELALACRIIEKHGGTISAGTDNNDWAVFSFTIPKQKPKPEYIELKQKTDTF